MENNTNKKEEFKLIFNRKFANAIEWLIGEYCYRFTADDGKIVYSFKNTDKFKKAYDILMADKAKFKNE